MFCGILMANDDHRRFPCPSSASTTPCSTSATSTTSVAFYTEALGFRVKAALPGAAFLQAEGSTNDHDLGLFAVGSPGRRLGRRAQHRRALPPRLGGRHPRRAAPRRRGPGRARRAGRRLGPRHDQGALRPRPRRPGVRGELARPGGPAHARPHDAHRAARPRGRDHPIRCGHSRRNRRVHSDASRNPPSRTRVPFGETVRPSGRWVARIGFRDGVRIGPAHPRSPRPGPQEVR